MTVCIAAIYASDSIVGASDRLVTAGDVEFEPASAKVQMLTNSIVAMTAGDANLSAEILGFVRAEIATHVSANPSQWLTVREVADRYCFHWAEAKRRRAELQILRPLGLDTSRLATEAATMNPASYQYLANGVLSFGLPYSAVILAGVDQSGPHIYVVTNGQPAVADSVGFAAIGIGSRHAESQLMAAQYAPTMSVATSLTLVHLAKVRAEVAPGVGSNTDMFVIGPALGSYMALRDPIMPYLRDQADRMRQDEASALASAQDGMRDFITNFGRTPEPQEAAPVLGQDSAAAPPEEDGIVSAEL